MKCVLFHFKIGFLKVIFGFSQLFTPKSNTVSTNQRAAMQVQFHLRFDTFLRSIMYAFLSLAHMACGNHCTPLVVPLASQSPGEIGRLKIPGNMFATSFGSWLPLFTLDPSTNSLLDHPFMGSVSGCATNLIFLRPFGSGQKDWEAGPGPDQDSPPLVYFVAKNKAPSFFSTVPRSEISQKEKHSGGLNRSKGKDHHHHGGLS